MRQFIARSHSCRRLIAAAILLVGFFGSLVIYITAAPPPVNPLGESGNSKKYLRDMEVYGGKANVLGAEFREWFDSLWHGRRLAVTVAFLTLVVLLFYLVASTPLPAKSNQSAPDKNDPGRTERRL